MRRPKTVAIDLRDRPAWMLGIVLAQPGLVLEDEATGERIRVLEDGHLERLLAGGRPGGVCAHSTATARRP